MAINMRAYAKLNIGLHVLGKRPDGFHNIHTHMQTIDLFDELALTSAPGPTEVTVYPPIEALEMEHNLVFQAITLFLNETGTKQHVQCALTKRIPIGAGLGGGSSDAAAALKGLNLLFDTGIDPTTLAEWGTMLGSDVPFFIQGGYACVQGRGERIRPLESPHQNHHFVVIVPPVACATPQVYAAWDQEHPFEYPDSECGQVQYHNDLQDVATQLYLQLKPLAELVRQAPTSLKGMSGSGSAFYAGFESESQAREYGHLLMSKATNVKVIHAQGVTS